MLATLKSSSYSGISLTFSVHLLLSTARGCGHHDGLNIFQVAPRFVFIPSPIVQFDFFGPRNT